jgi:FkbM family methyltransferase
MHKIKTFLQYFKDFIKWGEYRYIFTSIKYILLHKTTSRTQIYRSSLGLFLSRKGTLDFQFANYAYEWGVKKFVYKHLPQCQGFLDIGSNIGTYAILMAGKGLHGYAFEPIKSNYDALRINLILNQLEEKVTAFPVALGEKNRKAKFLYDTVNTGASHLASIHPEDETDAREESSFSEIVPLDSLMDQLHFDKEETIFIKIDVEGMEEKVLLGAKKFLQTYPNIIMVMESKHSGREHLTRILKEIADFEILDVDDLNMGARKINR